jgi:hypothetical protein
VVPRLLYWGEALSTYHLPKLLSDSHPNLPCRVCMQSAEPCASSAAHADRHQWGGGRCQGGHIQVRERKDAHRTHTFYLLCFGEETPHKDDSLLQGLLFCIWRKIWRKDGLWQAAPSHTTLCLSPMSLTACGDACLIYVRYRESTGFKETLSGSLNSSMGGSTMNER